MSDNDFIHNGNLADYYPGRANALLDNRGHDYGGDIGWALEYNAAPAVVQRDHWHRPVEYTPPAVPGPSAGMGGVALVAVLLLRRKKLRRVA